MSVSTTLRQLVMLKLIPKYPHYVLTKTLHQRLQSEGFDVSKRTVERDLDKLSTIVGLISNEQPEGFQWSFARINTELLPNMQPAEALLLNIAEQQLTYSLPIKALKELEPRFDKAKDTLDHIPRLNKWQEKIKVEPYGFPLKHTSISEQLREVIYDAVLDECQISVSYQKRHNQPQISYQLNPYGLIVRNYMQYLVASKVSAPEILQLFKFNRIKQVTVSTSPIIKSEANLQEFFDANTSGYLLEDTPTKAELTVGGPFLDLLLDNQLSDDQEISFVDKNELWATVTATVRVSYDLLRLILSYGKWVKVIGSQTLLNELERYTTLSDEDVAPQIARIS